MDQCNGAFPSNKDDRGIGRDERRPPLIMRYWIEGFIWHLEYEAIVAERRLPFIDRNKQTTPTLYCRSKVSPWFGMFFDTRGVEVKKVVVGKFHF